jgi:hypothetical protein
MGHVFKVYEKRTLRRIFGAEREDITGGWRKFHNEELYDLILHNMTEDEMGETCSKHDKDKKCKQISGQRS